MTTFAELVVKVSNNYKQATEDATRFEQQTTKTERAATSFANSSIILSQKVKSAIMAEDAAKLESHRKQIEMFTKQLSQLAEMKRVEERVTQEHQNQLNARLTAEKAYYEKIEALRKQAMLGTSQGNAASQTAQKGNAGVMSGLSQQNVVTAIQGPTITPAQLTANQAHSAQIAQRTALYKNMTAVMSQSNQTAETSKILINGMTASYRAEQERLASINATYNDHINRLTMTAREYHNLQLQQQGLTAAQANHITGLTQYSNSHSMLQRVLTKSLAIMTAMAAYRTLSFIITVPGELLTINKDMELLKIRLEALTGTIEKGRVVFKDLVSLDFKTPFNIKELTQAFLTLKNYGINPTERVMTALTDTISKMGGTSENLVGVSTQLGQAWSKGKLQMQDMRVIIENGVPIISLLAKTLGVNNEEILKMSKEGEITQEIISKLFDTMERESAGGSARMMNSLAGAISNVHTAWTLFVDAMAEDQTEGFFKTTANAFSNMLREMTVAITSVRNLENELSINEVKMNKLAKIKGRTKNEDFKTPRFSDENMEKELQKLQIERKEIVEALMKEQKIREQSNQESATETASNKAILLQEEEKLKVLDKQLALQEKYNVKENDTKNVVIDSKIADIKRITEEKINQYELEKENIIQLRDAEKISANEKFLKLQDISSKIHALNVQFKEKEYQLQLEKQAQVKSDFDTWWAAYLKVESYGGKSGTIGKTLAGGNQYAVGLGQVLPTTMMDPGIKGIFAFKPAKDENILSFKNDREKLLEWLKKHESELTEWTKKLMKTTYTLFNGDERKNFIRWGDPKDIKMYMDALGNMNGETIKQIQLNEESKNLSKDLGDLNISYAKEQTALQKELDDSKEKSNKLTKSQIKEVNDLRDAEIDRYNKATMSESKYYIERLKHTEKSPGVLLNEQEITTISGEHNRADIAEEQGKSYEKARASLEKYNENIGLAKESLSAMAQIGNTAFDGQLGGISTVTGALDKMISALQDNVKEFEKLAKIQKENENFIPKNDEDKKLQAELKIKYEKEYGSLETKNTMIAIDGVRQLASATSNMFEQNSNAAKAFNIIALAGLTAKAAGAILTQGEGDPYTAFARIAAMGSIVAAIMATAGAGGFNFSGSGPTMSKEDLAKVNGTGTVLGDNETASTSVDKTYELLKSIHASEYTELRGINSGISSLVSNISGTVNSAFKGGSLQSIATDESRLSQSAKNFKLVALSYAAMVNPLGALATFVLSKIPIIGDAINKVTDWVAGGLFGKISHAIIGTGISTNATNVSNLLDGSDIGAKKFDVDQTTKSSWFKTSYKYDVIFSQLDKNISDSLNMVFDNIGSTMLEVSKLLGNNTEEALRKYVIPGLTINLKGLSGEEASKQVNALISSTMDNIAQAVFGNIVEQYQKLGEGILETAIRIVSEIAVVKDALSVSGLAISTNAIGVSDALVQAAGGLEEFQKQFDIFYDKFYSDTEKQIKLTENLKEQLSEVFPNETINVLAKARENYREVIKAIDINTESGQAQFSMLINLAGAADSYYQSLEKVSKQLEDTVNSAFENLKKAVADNTKLIDTNLANSFKALQLVVSTEKTTITDAYNANVKSTQDSIDSLSKSVATLTSLSNILKSTLNNLIQPTRTESQILLKEFLHQAMSGNALGINQDSLQNVLTTITQPSEQLFKTFLDYQRDRLLTTYDVVKLNDITNSQLGTQQTLLDVANSQLETLKTTYETQTKQLDDILTNAQKQLDIANGNSISILSVNDAIVAFNNAVNEKLIDNNSTLIQTYQNQINAIYGTTNAVFTVEQAIKQLEQSMIAGYTNQKNYQSYSNEDILTYGRNNNLSSTMDWYNVAVKYNANPFQVGAALGLSINETVKALHDAQIPGFAAGGVHTGGWRIVGENGPELENTGPSHIFNNSDSMGILDNRLLIQEVKELKEELKRMREDMRAGHSTIANNTKESTKQLKKWDTDGMPEVRTI